MSSKTQKNQTISKLEQSNERVLNQNTVLSKIIGELKQGKESTENKP